MQELEERQRKIKKFSDSLTYKVCSEVLSKEFIKANNIEEQHTVSIIDGRELDVNDLCFEGHIPKSKDFKFYYFKKGDFEKKQYRIFEC